MESSIHFSLVIPTFNRANLIAKTINSALSQTYSNFEILIIDDGSTDNTEDVIKRINDKRISYYKIKNSERGAARNFGQKIAKGKYIVFFDSDDILYSNHLAVAKRTIDNFDSPSWMHLGYEIKDENGVIIKKVNNLNNQNTLISGNYLSCNAVFLRKDVAERHPFNEDRNLSALEDWELWLRISAEHKIIYCNEITSAIINHSSRSVLTTKKEQLIKRFDTFLYYVLSNKLITEYYKGKLRLLESSCYSYISLHISLTKKNRGTTLRYLFKGIIKNPRLITTRRFLAILKHFI